MLTGSGNELGWRVATVAARGRFQESPLFHLRYGEALFSTGDRNGAIRELRWATEISPQLDLESMASFNAPHASAHYLLATLYEEDMLYVEAAQSFDACLEKSPDDLDALLKSAALSIRLKQEKKATERLVALVSRPPEQTFSISDILGYPLLPFSFRY